MKIFVAIPSRDNRISTPTFWSLLTECEVARNVGDELIVSFLSGCSMLAHGRNQLAQRFMDGEGERLVFVDDDMSWEPGALVRLAHHSANVVGAAGRVKEDHEHYCVSYIRERDELWADDRGLIEVRAIGCAFLAISRLAFDKLRAARPERVYDTESSNGVFCYFHMPFDETLYGEDFAFCHDWRVVARGKIWVDPTITLGHWDGMREYRGCLGKWLKRACRETHALVRAMGV